MARHHRRVILFDNKKTLSEFKEAFDMIFSNGGPHTNRFIYEKEDLDTLNSIKYYALALVCDTGTWNYINAWHKFDRVTVYHGKFKTSHIHYAGPNYEEPKTVNNSNVKKAIDNITWNYINVLPEESKTVNNPTIKEVMDSMNDHQKKALYRYIGCIIDGEKAKAAYKNAYKTLDENQKKVCDYLVCQALEECDMEEDKIMLIKMPYYLKADARKKLMDEILASKELGVVLIPYGAEISYISKDVKIEIMDAGNRCLRENDISKEVTG